MEEIEELDAGDVLFQPSQEMFYVVSGVDDEHVRFAVHGWRSMGKDRLSDYLSEDGKEKFLYTEPEFREIIDDEDAESRFNELKSMVDDVYSDGDGVNSDEELK